MILFLCCMAVNGTGIVIWFLSVILLMNWYGVFIFQPTFYQREQGAPQGGGDSGDSGEPMETSASNEVWCWMAHVDVIAEKWTLPVEYESFYML